MFYHLVKLKHKENEFQMLNFGMCAWKREKVIWRNFYDSTASSCNNWPYHRPCTCSIIALTGIASANITGHYITSKSVKSVLIIKKVFIFGVFVVPCRYTILKIWALNTTLKKRIERCMFRYKLVLCISNLSVD